MKHIIYIGALLIYTHHFVTSNEVLISIINLKLIKLIVSFEYD